MDRNFSYEHVKEVYEKMGYDFYDKNDYNVNVFGIRSDNNIPNKFDDFVCIAYKQNGLGKVKVYDATTDPGLYWLKEPMNVNGTAIMVPGQYKRVYRVGLHKGQYEALTQNGEFVVWRDNNKDSVLDFSGKTYKGSNYGINIHRATPNKGMKSVQVDKWSAGCQVIAAKNDFDEFMSIIKKAKDIWGNKFTYTLFTEEQFFA